MAALEAAYQAGADGVEFDVRALGDGTLVLHHDPAFGRPGRRRRLAALARADLALLPPARRLDTFAEALHWAHERRRAWLDVELKEPGHEREVLRHLHEARQGNRVVITSFVPEVCQTARRIAPRVPVGLISHRREPRVVRTASDLGLPLVVLHQQVATADMLRSAYQAGLEVWTWGVGSTRAARVLVARGVTGLITDAPGRVRAAKRGPAFAVRRPAEFLRSVAGPLARLRRAFPRALERARRRNR